MMDGEEVYRARLEACLAAAGAASLPQVRDRHLAAAASWQALLIDVLERKRSATALQGVAEVRDVEEGPMSDSYLIPDPVVDAIEDGSTPLKAFRQSSGQSQHDVAAKVGMTDERLADLEQGATPHGLELATLSDELDVPVDLLINE